MEVLDDVRHALGTSRSFASLSDEYKELHSVEFTKMNSGTTSFPLCVTRGNVCYVTHNGKLFRYSSYTGKLPICAALVRSEHVQLVGQWRPGLHRMVTPSMLSCFSAE